MFSCDVEPVWSGARCVGYIRFLLAAIVLVGHGPLGSHLPIVGGLGAVEAFFVISGFYMAATYTQNYADGGRIAAFLASRALRLYPLYFVVVVAAGIFFHAATSMGWRVNYLLSMEYFRDTEAWKPNLSVWSLLFQDLLSVDPTTHQELPVRQAWSISAEIAFYVLVPFLCRWRTHLLAITIAAFTLKIALFYALGWRYAYFPFVSQLGYFTLGLWLYFHRDALTFGRRVGVAMSIGFTALVFLLGNASFEFGALWRHLFFIGALGVMMPTAFSHLDGRVSNRLGDLSYGIYLCHFLVLEMLFSLGLLDPRATALPELAAVTVAALTISGGIAWLFEINIQDGLDAWRRRVFYAGRADTAMREAVGLLGRPAMAIDPQRMPR